MTILYVLLAVLLLGILVAVHEFGHFISARAVGIDVMEYAIGMGPALFSRVGKKGTKFSIRAIPMGGFCAFYGEDDVEGTHKNDPRAYNNHAVWKRMISVLMGPGMNFLLALVVAVGFYWIGGVSEVTGYEPYIIEVNAAGPAHDAGLVSGDVIETINGAAMLDGTTDTLLDTIAAYREGDAPLHLTVRRGETTFETDLQPFYDEEEQKYRIGVTIGASISAVETRRVGLPDAVRYGADWCWRAGTAIWQSLGQLVTGRASLSDASGPVGVVSLVSEQVRVSGLEGFLNLLVFISINLGIVNLLPIPGLDGSRFLFMLLEAVRRKPIPPEKEAKVHLAGYVLLIGLMLVLTFNDILRLIR